MTSEDTDAARERPGPGAPSPSRPLARHPGLADGVYDALLEMIMDRRVTPGDPLRTEALARDLGVSATPVREALARLEATGLVVRSARRGYRAAPLMSREEMADFVDLRLVVEPACAERACVHGGAELTDALREQLAAQEAASRGPGYAGFRAFAEADWRFHQLVAEGSGNPFLARAFMSFGGYMQRFRLFEDHVVDDADESVKEHAAIVRAFESGSPAEASAAMHDHLERLLKRVASGL